ncbi:MAG: hypothetical protein ABH814_02455 [bacterium]
MVGERLGKGAGGVGKVGEGVEGGRGEKKNGAVGGAEDAAKSISSRFKIRPASISFKGLIKYYYGKVCQPGGWYIGTSYQALGKGFAQKCVWGSAQHLFAFSLSSKWGFAISRTGRLLTAG